MKDRSWKDIYRDLQNVTDEEEKDRLLTEAGLRDGEESWYINEIKKSAGAKVSVLNGAFSNKYEKMKENNEK